MIWWARVGWFVAGFFSCWLVAQLLLIWVDQL